MAILPAEVFHNPAFQNRTLQRWQSRCSTQPTDVGRFRWFQSQWAGMDKQEMSLSAPPHGSVPEWGPSIRFDRFSLELVPAGKRSFNVRLAKTLPTISFGTEEG